MKRAALYIRVSTEEQARHGLSLDEQRNALERYAKEHQYAVAGVYEDAGISARKPYKKRPALLRLLADCEAKRVDVILFIKLDRWFRNVGNYYAVQELLDRCGVTWQATQEDYETVTAAGRLKVNIMLSVAQDEADRTSERIKFVFEGKRARREPLTGNCPTGYKLEGKKFIKDPECAEAVQAFFDKFLACGSVSVAQQAALEHGKRIEYQTASKMLDKPVYYGFYYGVDGMAPAYITKEQFDKIQSMRVRCVRKTKENRVYLFSGLIVCGECGYHMAGKTVMKNRHPQYNCPAHYIKRSGCGNKTNLSEAKIERYLLDMVDVKLSQKVAEVEQMRQLQTHAHDHKQEIATCKSKLGKLKELYLNDLIGLDEYKADQARYTEQIAQLEAMDQPAPLPDYTAAKAALCDGWREDHAHLTRQEKAEFWRVLLKQIRLYPDRHIEFEING